MRKGRDGEKKKKKREKKGGKKQGKKTGKKKKKKIRMKIVATTSLPAVDRLNADCWNAACSCQKRRAYIGLSTYIKIQFFTAFL